MSLQETRAEEVVDYGALFEQLNQIGIEMLESLDRIHTLIQDIRTDVRAAYSSSEPNVNPTPTPQVPAEAEPEPVCA